MVHIRVLKKGKHGSSSHPKFASVHPYETPRQSVSGYYMEDELL